MTQAPRPPADTPPSPSPAASGEALNTPPASSPPPSPHVVVVANLADLDDTAEKQDTSGPAANPLASTRTKLAYIIIGTVPGLALLVMVGLFFQRISASDLKDVAIPLFTGAIGLAGPVIGFYYGERK